MILEKGSPIRDILKEEIRTRVSLLKSALDTNSEVRAAQGSRRMEMYEMPI